MFVLSLRENERETKQERERGGKRKRGKANAVDWLKQKTQNEHRRGSKSCPLITADRLK